MNIQSTGPEGAAALRGPAEALRLDPDGKETWGGGRTN